MKKIALYCLMMLLMNEASAQMNTLPTSGKVGIGIMSPTTLLQVGGTEQGVATVKGTSSLYPVLDLDNESIASGRKFRFSFKNNASALTLSNPTDAVDIMSFGSNGISVPGRIGIGTTSPAVKLDVKSADDIGSTTILKITSNDGTEGIAFGFEDIRQTGNGAPLNVNANGTGKVIVGNSSTGGVILASGGGNVGVGTNSPGARLDIKSLNDIGSTNILRLLSNDGTEGIAMGFEDIKQTGNGAPLNVNANGNGKVILGNTSTGGVLLASAGGNVGIGTTSPAEKLSVQGNVYVLGNTMLNGTVRSKKMTVTQVGWSDYVFDEDYKLRSLSSVEKYIQQNKHLPEVPSAKEVEEKGIDIGDTQALLLKKIEELTLYIIDLKKNETKLSERLALVEEALKKNKK